MVFIPAKVIGLVLIFVSLVFAQEYDYGQDYEEYPPEDNLYADYAQRQIAKEQGGGGGGIVKTLAFGAATWVIGGKVHSSRAVKKLKKKHWQEQKDLYKKYYSDMITLQAQNQELKQFVNDVAKQQWDEIDREFAVADVDRDNKVSRAEFNMYRKQYLAKYPEMEKDFHRFEDFDPDADGYISKREYDAYYQKTLNPAKNQYR